MRLRLVLLGGLWILPLASAHGGEDTLVEEVLSNGQILLISVLGSLVIWLITNSMLAIKASLWTPVMMGLLAYTGLVHVLLGIDETLLLVGGLGALAGVVGLTLVELKPTVERRASFALAGGLCVMVVGFFLANHDLHMLLEDQLGLSTKLVELLLLVLMFRRGTFTAEKNN